MEWGVTLVVFFVAGLSMLFLDRPLILWVDHVDVPSTLVKGVSELGKSQWYLVGALVAYPMWPRASGKARISLLFWSVALSGILVDLVKVLLARPRPELFLEHGLYGFDFLRVQASYLSFPSGHTATAFSVGACLALFWPRGRVVFLAGAASIGTARILLAQHYPSDVFVGAWFGTFTVLWLNRNKKHSINDPSPMAGGDPGDPPRPVLESWDDSPFQRGRGGFLRGDPGDAGPG